MLSIDNNGLRTGLSRARFVGMCYAFYLPTREVGGGERSKYTSSSDIELTYFLSRL